MVKEIYLISANIKGPIILSLLMMTAACDNGENGVHTTFGVWECHSEEAASEMNLGIEKAIRNAGFSFSKADITQGGRGLVFVAEKDNLKINILVPREGEISNVVATHVAEPSFDEISLTNALVGTLPVATCQPVEAVTVFGS